jgi:peptide/nickel transport system ATP-binding protein
MAAVDTTLLSIEDLHLGFRLDPAEAKPTWAVQGVSFQIPENATLALVGESGSGKSVTALSILNLLPPNAVRRGRIRFQNQDLLALSPSQMRALRGRSIGCVFQDPMSALNPVFTVGHQIIEPLRLHLGLSQKQARTRALELLNEVGLPDPQRRLNAYPHQLSGGQQQRIMIAMAVACEPRLLIADEPTTALDVTIQRQILELLARLKEQHRMSLLFISHDLGLVGEVADSVVVMRHGRIREQGSIAQLFTAAQDAYTQALLACRPRLEHRPARLPTLDEHQAQAQAQTHVPTPVSQAKDTQHGPVVLEVRGLTQAFWIRKSLWRRAPFYAVGGHNSAQAGAPDPSLAQPKGVSFSLRQGQTLGIVGESGSGKTTLGLALLRLIQPREGSSGGQAIFQGQDILALDQRAMLPLRRRLQVVFQNPYASLNPRFTVAQSLLEPLIIHNIGQSQADRLGRAKTLLEKVGLDAHALHKYPHEFSGGQRQRIAIARCLSLEPQVLVLDEAVSALDVSVQAQVLNLLRDLQDELGLAYLFISHDLAVVRFMADDVLVMKDGVVMEHAPVDDILLRPKHAYTRSLIQAVARGYSPNSKTALAASVTP